MSINSLTGNPKIIDELVLYIQEHLTTTGITTLQNDDNNLDIAVVGGSAIVNFKNNIEVTGDITTDEVLTTTVYNPSDILVEVTNQAGFNVGSEITLSTEPNKYVVLNAQGNLNLDGCLLKLDNMTNPFSSTGTNGQLLATTGNNTFQWVSSTFDGYLRNIISQQSGQLSPQSVVPTLNVVSNYNATGFSVGKQSIIRGGFTFNSTNTSNQIIIKLYINGNVSQQLFTQVNQPEYSFSVFRGFTFVFNNVSESQTISITVENVVQNTVLFNSTTNDYYSFNIQEIH